MSSQEGFNGVFHIDANASLWLVLLGILVTGILHGLTPHGHSWLVLLPFALGGVKARGMLRIALAYSAGMLVAGAAAGALLSLISSFIPESWHMGIEIAVGVALILTGLLFLLKPFSVHHAMDHLCSEHCHSGEEQKLLKSGTFGALFTLGAMSMLVPCQTNIWVYYTLPSVTRSPLVGSLFFTLYALFTSIVLTIIAVAMARARGFIEKLEDRGHRLLIWRISGLLVLAVGIGMLWIGLHPHEHHHEMPAGVHQHDAHDHQDEHDAR